MTTRSKAVKAKAYASVGTTTDGVRILKPKTKPKSFTSAQIRATIRKVLRERRLQQEHHELAAESGSKRSA